MTDAGLTELLQLLREVEDRIARAAGGDDPLAAALEAAGPGTLAALSTVVAQLSRAVQRAAAGEASVNELLYDPVTGLPNLLPFVDQLDRALARARRHGWQTAVMAIALRRSGDDDADHGALLLQLGPRLRDAVRSSDASAHQRAARLGEGEFLLLCENVADTEAALIVVRRVALALQRPIDLGIVLAAPGRDADGLTLVREAEAALRDAQREGGGHRFHAAAPD